MIENISNSSSYNKLFTTKFETTKKSSSKSKKKDYSKIKMLIASLSAAKTSFEASIYVTKLREELASLQTSASTDDSAMIRKVKKIIQNGDKKVRNLQNEEKLEQEKQQAEIKGDKVSEKEITSELNKKRKSRQSKEHIKLPNDNNSLVPEPMTVENLNVTI